MSVNIARASDRKLLSAMFSVSSWRGPSNNNNEFLAHIPVGDRIFSTNVTDGTSARSGLEKAVSEQGGIVLTYFDKRYNAYEIVGVWLPDGFTYCSGDQKKVAAALNQSNIALDSTIGTDMLNESSFSEGKGSMHFYLGKDGIPFTRDTNDVVQFFNADEFTFTKNRSVISWANTNSAFDPQTISDFDQKYAHQGGVAISNQAQKELELAHGGNRVSGVLLDTTIVCVVKASTGEITSASEYNIALDFAQIQASNQFAASQLQIPSIAPQIIGVQFSTGNNSTSFDFTSHVSSSSPTPQIPIAQYGDLIRLLSLTSAQNDNSSQSKSEHSVHAGSVKLLFSDSIRFMQRQQALAANDNSQQGYNSILADPILQSNSRLSEIRSRSDSTQLLSLKASNFFIGKPATTQRPGVSSSLNPANDNSFDQAKGSHLNSAILSIDRLINTQKIVVFKKNIKHRSKSDVPKAVKILRSVKIKDKTLSRDIQLKKKDKKPKIISKSTNQTTKLQTSKLVPFNRPISKIPKKQFASFKMESEKPFKKLKIKNIQLNRSAANDNAVNTRLGGKSKVKSKALKPNNVIDLAKYRSRKQAKSEQLKTTKVKLQRTQKPVVVKTHLEQQVSKVLQLSSAKRILSSKNNRKNKKKIPEALFRELIGLFQLRKYKRKLAIGTTQVGSLG